MIEVLDLFSAAAGGWSLGLHRAGFATIAACESEAWRRAIYSENNPNAKVYDDVRTLTAERLLHDLGRLPSIVVGSPPCQDISSANTKGLGVAGARSGLYFEAIRIVGEVRPRWFALENSANLRTRGADPVIAALEALGYACWPLVVRAGDSARSRAAGFGANHERPRCWLIGCDLEQVGDPGGWSIGPIGTISGRESAFNEGSAAASANRDGEYGVCQHDEVALLRGVGDNCGIGDAADTACPGYAGRSPIRSGRPTRNVDARGNDAAGTGSLGSRDAANAYEARQEAGCMVASLRSPEVAIDGRGARRCAARYGSGQMGVRPPDSDDADRSGPEWSLAHLADHLRLDDGLSARLAGTRVALGAGKGQSAASLIVEAFGDAVVPQIPEAIGRAILRAEAALVIALGAEAA